MPFYIKLTGNFVNLEFSAINLIITPKSVGFNPIQGKKIKQVMLTLFALLRIERRLFALLFFFLSNKTKYVLNVEIKWFSAHLHKTEQALCISEILILVLDWKAAHGNVTKAGKCLFGLDSFSSQREGPNNFQCFSSGCKLWGWLVCCSCADFHFW